MDAGKEKARRPGASPPAAYTHDLHLLEHRVRRIEPWSTARAGHLNPPWSQII
jgi:hypothetical protein